MTTEAEDAAIRTAAATFLSGIGSRQAERWPVVSRSTLSAGFEFAGRRVSLIGPQGIFKPAVLDLPLSITTAPRVEGKAPAYDDEFGYGRVVYRYRGTDPRHPDNVGLRAVMAKGLPLVYLHGLVPGRYLATWPVYVISDSPQTLSFGIALEQPMDTIASATYVAQGDMDRREYGLRLLKRRLHQEGFRQRVLRAYHTTCAVCRLRHEELLDAAHILPDGHPRGLPIVPNGLTLCKLHHAAFDANIIGIRPDLMIEVRRDILIEADGPMLQHGLQGAHGKRIWVPHKGDRRPLAENLEERYEGFRAAV
jgi:putative restriction endonuclease